MFVWASARECPPGRSAREMDRGLSPEPSASADAEALLDGPVFLAVLLRRPDERPSDDREREHADRGNHYPEKSAHSGSLGSTARRVSRLRQRA